MAHVGDARQAKSHLEHNPLSLLRTCHAIPLRKLNDPDEVRAAWRAGIAAVAACPNITLKLGGLGMPRMGFDWHTRAVPIGSEELAADMAPWMQYCIEQFGPERCMFESNFPLDKVSFSYNVMYNAFKRLSRAYSPAERAAMFHDTAAKVYRIDV